MRTIKGLRWWIIALVTLGTILNYLARSTLSVAAPTLKDDLGLTTEQYSWVVMAFQAAYTAMQPFAGAVLDFLGTRLGFALFAVGWALANMGHAFAAGWQGLAFWRGLLGASEAAAIPGGIKTVSEWFPPRERTVATGWFNIGAGLGSMIAPVLVSFCILVWGWQSAFLVTGGISLLWAGLWYWGYRSPRDHARLGPEELAYIESGRVAAPSDAPLPTRQILRQRAFWSIAIPRFLADPAWQTFNFFIPLYLVTVWKLDLKTLAIWAWLPFLAADLGCIAGGYFAPFLMRSFNASLLTSRKVTVTIGALCMLGPACIGLATDYRVTIALFCLGGFAHQMLSGALMTLAADLFDARAVGRASGLAGSAAWIGGMLFTFLIGKNADVYGYDPLFAALGALDILAALMLWALLPRKGKGATA